jgi:hypothetical protein
MRQRPAPDLDPDAGRLCHTEVTSLRGNDMTATNTATGPTKSVPVATSLVRAMGDLRDAALRYAAAKASRKIGHWADDLNDVLATGSPITRAVVEGLQAKLLGKNPVWAAIKGAWSAASFNQKLAVVLTLIVMLLLALVVLLVLILGLLIAALVAGVRAAVRSA